MELRRFVGDGLPVGFGIGEVAFVAVEQGQVMTHPRPPQARIDAGESTLGPCLLLSWWGRGGVESAHLPPTPTLPPSGGGRKQLQPTGPRPGTVAALTAQLALEEQQFGVFGMADVSGLAHGPGLLELSQAVM